MTKISIHAPLAGCDLRHGGVQRVHEHFNPRTPCGVRLAAVRSELEQANFNPRTPCGVRPHLLLFPSSCCNFNPRTPCGVRRGSTDQALQVIDISIHAPLAGCDRPYPALRRCQANFNPRTPCGVRPYVRGLVDQDSISIHAPLAGCDVECGLRLIGYSQFQSTHPLRGATREALLVARWKRYFNPRTPCGVRPYLDLLSTVVVAISIHAPLAGCDRPRSPIGFTPTYFNPRTPCGVRRAILRP